MVSREPVFDSNLNASDISSDIYKAADSQDQKISIFDPDQAKPSELSMSDSDDSCIILENVSKPQHLLLENKESPFLADSEYSHKKDLIYAAYGRSQSRLQEHSDASKGPERVKSPDLSEFSESSSESSSSSCESSPDETRDVEMVSVSSPSCPSSSSDELQQLPPTLEPAMPTAAHQTQSDIDQSDLSTKELENADRVECASQTMESLFQYTPSSSPDVTEVPNVRLAPPPVLQGQGSDHLSSQRGRPRKNPPMLKPQNTTNESSDEELDVVKETVKKQIKKRKKNKDKLSVLFSVAKLEKKEGKEKSRELINPEGRAAVYESDSEQSDTNIREKRVKSSKRKIREKRREKYSKSKVQKSTKHKSSHHSRSGGEKRRSRKEKPAGSAEDSDSRSKLNTEEHEKARRHKMRRERKKTKKDSCFEWGDFTKKSKRPASADEIRKSSKERHPFRPASQNETEKRRENVSKSFINSEIQTAHSMLASESQPKLGENLTDHEENNFLSIFTVKSSEEGVNHFALTEPAAKLVFPKQFCSLKPDKFWKDSKRSVQKIEPEAAPTLPTSGAPAPAAKDQGNSVFTTKASVKVRQIRYTVMQSDRNISETDTFHEPSTYEPHV